jgi:hypothetical protein
MSDELSIETKEEEVIEEKTEEKVEKKEREEYKGAIGKQSFKIRNRSWNNLFLCWNLGE